MIVVKPYQVSMMATNCFLLVDSDTHELALVDPGEYSEEIFNEINNCGGKLKYILLTHGHFDHIGGVSDYLKKFPEAKVYIGEKDKICLSDDDYNLSSKMFRRRFEHFNADLLTDGEFVQLGNTKIKFIHTPGHTAGSGCYMFDDKILSGDTLFMSSCGRTDFPGSSSAAIIRSLSMLSKLEGEYIIYPGHGEFTTLSQEKIHNPFMSNYYEDCY